MEHKRSAVNRKEAAVFLGWLLDRAQHVAPEYEVCAPSLVRPTPREEDPPDPEDWHAIGFPTPEDEERGASAIAATVDS